MATINTAQKTPDPCSFVIFGVTGDLAHRLVVPALYNLAATNLLPDDIELVTQGMRTELMLPSIQWSQVKGLAEATLKSRPDDVRALYLLARIEFEQPTADDPTKSTPLNKRNSARIRKSLEYLAELKKNAQYPPWRVAFLEAKIHGWTIEDAQRRGEEAVARTLDWL